MMLTTTSNMAVFVACRIRDTLWDIGCYTSSWNWMGVLPQTTSFDILYSVPYQVISYANRSSRSLDDYLMELDDRYLQPTSAASKLCGLFGRDIVVDFAKSKI